MRWKGSRLTSAIFRASYGTPSRRLKRRLAGLRQQLDDQASLLDHQGQQILELQERTDFMERLLAKSREGTSLNPGDSGKGS